MGPDTELLPEIVSKAAHVGPGRATELEVESLVVDLSMWLEVEDRDLFRGLRHLFATPGPPEEFRTI